MQTPWHPPFTASPVSEPISPLRPTESPAPTESPTLSSPTEGPTRPSPVEADVQSQQDALEHASLHKLHTLANCAAFLTNDSLGRAVEARGPGIGQVDTAPGQAETAPGQAGTAPGQISFGSKARSAFVHPRKLATAASVLTPVKIEVTA